MLKKLLIVLTVLLLPATAFAAPVSWDFTSNVLQPLQSGWTALIKGDHFQATSTATASTFPYASTTAISVSGNLWLTALGTPAGAVIAVDANGKVIATTTSAGGVTSVTGTYPIISSGGNTPAISLAFGTTTSNTWAGTQTFTYASTTGISGSYASSTNAFFGTLNLPNITGTQCLHEISGVVSGTGSDCGSGGGGAAFPFTPLTSWGVNTSATTTALWGQNSIFASSTSATIPALSVSNTTGPAAVFGQGNVGIGTSSPMNTLSVVGSEAHYGAYAHFGLAAPLSQCNTALGASSCLELVGSDNTTGGVGIYEANTNSGTSAYGGYVLTNNLTGNATTNYSGLFLNSSTYSDTTFGTLEAVPNLLQLGNSMGPVSIQSFAPTQAASYVNFFAGSTTPGAGPAASGEGMRLTSTGLGIGTTSPYATLSIGAAAQTNPYFAIGSTTSQVLSVVPNAIPLLGIGTTSPLALISAQSLYNSSSTPLLQLNIIGSTSPSLFVDSPDKSGFVGIGTSSPAKTLSVGGNLIIGASAAGGASGTLTYGNVTLSNTVTGTGGLVLSSGPTIAGQLNSTNLQVSGNIKGGSAVTSALILEGTSAAAPTTASITLQAGTTASVIATLLPVGLGLGTTTPNWSLEVATSSASAANGGSFGQIAITDTNAGTNLKHWLLTSMNGSYYISTTSDAYASSTKASFALDANGQLYLNNYANCNGTTNALGITSGQIQCDSLVSDQRLKKDIIPLSGGLATIMALKPVTFFWKDLTNHNTSDPRQQEGFIAQEVQKLLPTAIGKSPDGYQTLDKAALVAPLVQAVQEQQKEIEALGGGKAARSVEENYQWVALLLLFMWNLFLTFKRK